MREKTSHAVHASRTAMLFRQPLRGFFIATIAAVFFSIIGALGTDEAPVGKRLIYWLLVMNSGAALGAFVTPVIKGWGRLRAQILLEGALVSLVITIPLTIILIGANTVFFQSFGGWTDALAMFAIVLMVSAIITTLNYLTEPAPAVTVAQAAPPVTPPRLCARLPQRLQFAKIKALEAEDHYLRIHTDQGSELILMRLSDAIGELDGLDGARCHRSWWVARGAVVDSMRRGNQAMLSLDIDIDVPVSRTYRPVLKAAGWLR